jgi:hypothetical protein
MPNTAIGPRWLAFVLQPRLAERKTDNCWTVMPIGGGNELGEVKWFPAWRRFCFYPAVDTAFDQACLREIADFCEEKRREWRVERFAS